MLPLRSLQQKALTLLGADTASFNNEDNYVSLILSAFTPGDAALLAGFSIPTTGGLAPKVVGAVPPLTSIDPLTGQIVLTMIAPLGGWQWVTTDTVGLNVTVFGFAVRFSGVGAWIACEQLPEPVILTGIGQEVTLREVSVRLPFGVMV